jgi:hypothetical protein
VIRAALPLAILAFSARLASAGPVLAALAPGASDDAHKAVALGAAGQVYTVDAAGDYVRTQAFATADTLAVAGRSGASVVALGDGVVYRLADNGWTAIRLVQKGKAVMSGGRRSVAAVGRQLFALDRTVGGEPAKLALAPFPVLAIASGDSGAIVIQTERGLMRLEGAAWKRIDRAPRGIRRLVSDRWVQLDRGAADLVSGAALTWPAGLTVQIVETAPDGSIVAIGATRAGLELVTLGSRVAAPAPAPARGKRGRAPAPAPRAPELVRDPIDGTAGAKPVGVVIDKAGRVTVALADGRIARRDRKPPGTWTLTAVREALPAGRPGASPAVQAQ